MILDYLIEKFDDMLNRERTFYIVWHDKQKEFTRIIDEFADQYSKPVIICRENDFPLKKKKELFDKTGAYEGDRNEAIIYIEGDLNQKIKPELLEFKYTEAVYDEEVLEILRDENLTIPTDKKELNQLQKTIPSKLKESLGRGREYWQRLFSNGNSVIPNFQQHFFDMLITSSPSQKADELDSKGLLNVFKEKCKEKFGINLDSLEKDTVRKYKNKLIRNLILIDVYQNSTIKEQFNYKEVIPDRSYFNNYINLLDNWLDSKSRSEYYQKYQEQIIQEYNLKEFIQQDMNPSLAAEEFSLYRYEKLLEEINNLNNIRNIYETIDDYNELIYREVNKSPYSNLINKWKSIKNIHTLLELMINLQDDIGHLNEADEFINNYYTKGYEVDSLFREIVNQVKLDDKNLRELKDKVSSFYKEFLHDYNAKFNNFLVNENFKIQNKQFKNQSEILSSFSADTNKTALIFLDAFRYELAREFMEDYQFGNVNKTSEVVISSLPSKTSVGMANLVSNELKYIYENDALKLYKEGLDLSVKQKRINYLKNHLNGFTNNTKDKFLKDIRYEDYIKEGKNLIISSLEIDRLGENTSNIFDYMEQRLSRLEEVINILIDNKYEIHIMTDHGFLYVEGITENDRLPANSYDTLKVSDRFLLSEDICDSSLPYKKLNDDLFVTFPEGINIFRTKGGYNNYFHGGISLQELVIPYIKLTPKDNSEQNILFNIKADDELAMNLFAFKLISENEVDKGVNLQYYIKRKDGKDKLTAVESTEYKGKKIKLSLAISSDEVIHKGEELELIVQKSKTGETVASKNIIAQKEFDGFGL
ncbi:hypothetical protein JCM16358_11630 [Halanaerocella petrolearia]